MPSPSSIRPLLTLMFVITLTACSTVYYETMEKFGIEKREILTDRVASAQKAQVAAKDEFASALEKFRTVIKVDGGDLQDKYDRLKKELESAESRAETVHKRIEAVETVAEDLFDEWTTEIKQYENQRLAESSRSQLKATQARYAKLIRQMHAAESRIDPVLRVFRDQVMYLKHNLNARAIASIETELRIVEADVSALISAMDASIAEAQSFLASENL